MNQTPNWPFPPPGGPVPWTEKQKRDYERQQRQREKEDRNTLPEAPF